MIVAFLVVVVVVVGKSAKGRIINNCQAIIYEYQLY